MHFSKRDVVVFLYQFITFMQFSRRLSGMTDYSKGIKWTFEGLLPFQTKTVLPLLEI